VVKFVHTHKDTEQQRRRQQQQPVSTAGVESAGRSQEDCFVRGGRKRKEEEGKKQDVVFFFGGVRTRTEQSLIGRCETGTEKWSGNNWKCVLNGGGSSDSSAETEA
jgi:hypothetical protein